MKCFVFILGGEHHLHLYIINAAFLFFACFLKIWRGNKRGISLQYLFMFSSCLLKCILKSSNLPCFLFYSKKERLNTNLNGKKLLLEKSKIPGLLHILLFLSLFSPTFVSFYIFEQVTCVILSHPVLTLN